MLTKLLRAWAQGFARVDARANNLLNEIDPRIAFELLEDWERVASLPDPCVVASVVDQSVEQRRAALYSKLTDQACVSRQDFIDLAAKFGYPGATIDEFHPFTCESYCDESLWSEDDRFAWQLNLPSTGGVFVMTCESPCDSFLASWGDTALECRVNQLKHAETDVVFAYV